MRALPPSQRRKLPLAPPLQPEAYGDEDHGDEDVPFDSLAAAASAQRALRSSSGQGGGGGCPGGGVRISRRALPHQLAEVDEIVFGRDTDASNTEDSTTEFGRRRTEITRWNEPVEGLHAANQSGALALESGWSKQLAPDIHLGNQFDRKFAARESADYMSNADAQPEEGRGPKYGRRRFKFTLLPADFDLLKS